MLVSIRWEGIDIVRIKAISGIAVAAMLAAAPASAAIQIVDISAGNDVGTTVALAAGTYTIHFIDSSKGGFYDGYSPWSSNSGCDAAGMNCSTGFIENLAIDFGHGGTLFNHVDGYQYGQFVLPGNNHIFDTGAKAIADIESGDIVRATLPQYSDTSAYSSIGGPITFTLSAAQSVNFFILDYPYSDNRGGVSITLDDGIPVGTPGVPEPASWAMLIAGMAVVGLAMRRRPATATVSFA